MPARRPAARILMPWIEKLQAESEESAKGSKLHFIFAIHWDKLVDGEDAEDIADLPVVPMRVPVHHLAEEGSGSLPSLGIGVPPQLRPFADAMQQILQKLSQEENERRSEVLLSLADPVLGACLSRVLASRTTRPSERTANP